MVSITRLIGGIAIKGIPGNQSILKISGPWRGRKGKKGSNEELKKEKKFSLQEESPKRVADDIPANHYLIL